MGSSARKMKMEMDVEANRGRFVKAIADTFSKQMKDNPERVSDLVKDEPEYPTLLGQHLLEKFQYSNIVVINDTVAMAAKKLELEPKIDTIYEFLGYEPPNTLAGIKGLNC